MPKGRTKSTAEGRPGSQKEELSFEQALGELEATVELLEGGELSLEEQVAQYERGLKLLQLCRGKLEEAAARIAQVVEVAGGEVAEAEGELEGEVEES